jgi:Carbohydrate esterase, sialic acid-specific acetylesterase
MDIFGPEMALAHTVTPRLKTLGIRRAYFIKFAMGSTNLHSNWNPSNSASSGRAAEIGHYQKFLKFTKDSLASCGDLSSQNQQQISGMFWLQGESDSSKAKDANAYLSNLQHFIEMIRRDIECPNMPVVVSPIRWHGKKVKVINQALKQAESVVLFAWILWPRKSTASKATRLVSVLVT